jgi:hypothetical protein
VNNHVCRVCVRKKDSAYRWRRSALDEQERGNEHASGDENAFGERLGAAGIRDTVQGVFTDSVFAPLLHEDPRYYVGVSSTVSSIVRCMRLRGR